MHQTTAVRTRGREKGPNSRPIAPNGAEIFFFCARAKMEQKKKKKNRRKVENRKLKPKVDFHGAATMVDAWPLFQDSIGALDARSTRTTGLSGFFFFFFFLCLDMLCPLARLARRPRDLLRGPKVAGISKDALSKAWIVAHRRRGPWGAAEARNPVEKKLTVLLLCRRLVW